MSEKSSWIETGHDLLDACSNQVIVKGVVVNDYSVTFENYVNYIEVWAITVDDKGLPDGKLSLVELRYRSTLPMGYGGDHDPLKVRCWTDSASEIEKEADGIVNGWKNDMRKFPRWWFLSQPSKVMRLHQGFSESDGKWENAWTTVHPSNIAFLIEYHLMLARLWELPNRESLPGRIVDRFHAFTRRQLETWTEAQSLQQIPLCE